MNGASPRSRKGLRIGMVLDKFFPPDPRVEEEARSLHRAGHEVFLFCLGRPGEDVREDRPELHVRRRLMGEVLRRKGGALSLTLPFYTGWFERRLPDFVEAEGIEALHVHDLRLAAVGEKIASRFGMPWVLDLHENLPAIMREYHHTQTLLGRLLISPSAWERFQKRMVHRPTRVVVVTKAAVEDFVRRYGLHPDRIVDVPNVATQEYVDREIKPPPPSGFRAIYIGETGLRRGTDLAIRAVAELKDRIPGLELVLAGTSADQSRLKDLARDLGVSPRVRFLGWTEPEELPGHIEASHVGLAPFRRNLHHDTTFANKLFQYMALSRPVVVSDCPAQAEVVTTESCGLVFHSGRAEDLARCIGEIAALPDRGAGMGRNGREAVARRYNWRVTGKNLVGLYEQLLAAAPAGSS